MLIVLLTGHCQVSSIRLSSVGRTVVIGILLSPHTLAERCLAGAELHTWELRVA
jgi:hypothetical protein